MSSPHQPHTTCPRCQNQLLPRVRNGVDVDYCSGCGGVWLDRGELEKIIERSYRNRVSQFSDEADDAEDDFGFGPTSNSGRSVA